MTNEQLKLENLFCFRLYSAARLMMGAYHPYLSKIPTDPKVISCKIARAAVCRHPKTRYRTGRGAKFMVFLHTIFPARWWDWLVVKSTQKM